jgi:nucleoside-diphosphate-sugar epimerase
MAANQGLHVVFGSGPLGLAVMRALVKEGKPVRVVNRSGKLKDAPVGVEVTAADAFNPAEARQAAQGAAVVYQCAQPAYTEWPEKFPPLQANILEAAASAGAKLIVGDNLYMYGPVDGPLTEDLPNRATFKKGATRARMAEAVMEAHARGKVKAAIARASDFYGPAATNSQMGERVFYPMLQGKTASAAGDLDAPHSYTYIGDFGKALAILGEQEQALGQIWHVPNQPALTTRQFLTRAFEILGLPPKMSGMSKLMMRIGGLFIPEARESVEVMYQFEQPFVVDSSKFVKAFGDISTPYEPALRATLDWYRANPQNGH